MLAHLPPHPHVVQYFGCWTEAGGTAGEGGSTGEHLYLQLEKCDVNLGIHASLGEQLKEAELLDVLRQVGWVEWVERVAGVGWVTWVLGCSVESPRLKQGLAGWDVGRAPGASGRHYCLPHPTITCSLMCCAAVRCAAADGVCAGAPAPPRRGAPGRQARQHLPARPARGGGGSCSSCWRRPQWRRGRRRRRRGQLPGGALQAGGFWAGHAAGPEDPRSL